MGQRPRLGKDEQARLARAVEAARAARAEMADRALPVPRKRELRRVVREGDQAAEALVTANVAQQGPAHRGRRRWVPYGFAVAFLLAIVVVATRRWVRVPQSDGTDVGRR
jgi:hypothetical protein